ncbi:hypothetical protein H6P81_003500 [Aristolochia fimbriata]|uniref:Germin-like protein n=1 Tax=Aristolochia fimbriata TaxID=158543 RepID=A0AAV7FCQ8_ARIFI|nr:hypothetical protein H6P81_003500 [Aristolochia fimbriata]
MASSCSFLLLLAVVFAISNGVVHAGDPDILSDFLLPANNGNLVNESFFTFSGVRNVLSMPPPPKFTVSKASMAQFPALEGQSVSYAILQYPSGSLNPPHTHPRSAELLLLIFGSLEVGFVDTTNKLYTQTLQVGDMFVFPKGLVHYQYNADAHESATAISAFGSANAGTVSVPGTLFNTSIDDGILAQSFKTDVATIQKIKAGQIRHFSCLKKGVTLPLVVSAVFTNCIREGRTPSLTMEPAKQSGGKCALVKKRVTYAKMSDWMNGLLQTPKKKINLKTKFKASVLEWTPES